MGNFFMGGAKISAFAAVISNNPGCGVQHSQNVSFGETVWRSTLLFLIGFAIILIVYQYNEEQLPVDQHELLL